MDERLKFIALVKSSDESFAECCRRSGISRKTGYKWLSRYDEEGPGGLDDRPPIAVRIRHKLSRELVAKIIAMRKEHPTWGPRKIRACLADHCFWAVPAASTIGDILKQYGLVSEGRRAPRRPRPTLEMQPTSAPNETWCVDFKGHFATRQGPRCYPLTVSDHQTRYLLKCEALDQPDEEHVRPHFEMAFREFGLPQRIRSDNGPPFATVGLGGLSKLSAWWMRLGITLERIEPGHPEQNGRHERMHRTLKADVPREKDLLEQQLAFDRFRSIYNEVRPHEALGQKPPAKFYRPSRRQMPSKLPEFDYFGMETRKLDQDGRMRFGGSTHVVVSRALAGETVGLEQISEDTWTLYFGAMALADLRARNRSVVFLRASAQADPEQGSTTEPGSGP